MTVLLSVIIPVFNVEEFVDECVGSVLTQRYRDFELIIVDDGSSDASGSICEEYSRKSDRVTLVREERNMGVSRARNTGLARATGEYVVFVDGDDWLSEGALGELAEYLTQHPGTELVTWAHRVLYQDGSTQTRKLQIESALSNLTRDQFLAMIHADNRGFWSPWQNVYRRNCISDWQIEFDEGLALGEDAEFFYDFVSRAHTFGFLDFPAVNYRVGRPGSALASRDWQKALQLSGVFRRNFYRRLTDDPVIDKMTRTYFANMYANSLLSLCASESCEMGNAGAQPCCVSCVDSLMLRHTAGLKYRAARIAWRLLGFRRGSQFLAFVSRLRTLSSSSRVWLDGVLLARGMWRPTVSVCHPVGRKPF